MFQPEAVVDRAHEFGGGSRVGRGAAGDLVGGVVGRKQIQLRVYERGAGETLACGTGACAAAVAGMQLGLLERRVEVLTRGGLLGVEWGGGSAPVLLSGPATTVFSGDIDLPDDL